MTSFVNKGKPDRSRINMKDPEELKYWTRHLKVTEEQLQKVVIKVGNSAASVRKEIEHSIAK